MCEVGGGTGSLSNQLELCAKFDYGLSEEVVSKVDMPPYEPKPIRLSLLDYYGSDSFLSRRYPYPNFVWRKPYAEDQKPPLRLKQREWGFVVFVFGGERCSFDSPGIYINGVLWYLLEPGEPLGERLHNAFLETDLGEEMEYDEFIEPSTGEVITVPNKTPETHLIAVDFPKR